VPREARAPISLLLLARTPDISARDISRFRNRFQKTGLAASGGSSGIPRLDVRWAWGWLDGNRTSRYWIRLRDSKLIEKSTTIAELT